MGLPSGTFKDPESGRLVVMFSGEFGKSSGDWGSGKWSLVLKCTAGERETSISFASTSNVIEIDYVGGTAVACSMEHVSHSFGAPGWVWAVNLRITCRLLK